MNSGLSIRTFFMMAKGCRREDAIKTALKFVTKSR